ncbi:MAG: hypothetical protein A2W22_04775 [Candidatus Levybacteria bacterium RBG_16_35_11]|nr:MAG: hypothetical protein A2W22_04775 [Candidatus Levybacteria bacterium RBG_16_35_11]
MSLIVEIWNPFKGPEGKWQNMGELCPGQRSKSYTTYTSEGEREIVLFRCNKQDSESVIRQSKDGIRDLTKVRKAVDSEDFVTIATLCDGQSHEVELRPNPKANPLRIKFTQQKGGLTLI